MFADLQRLPKRARFDNEINSRRPNRKKNRRSVSPIIRSVPKSSFYLKCEFGVMFVIRVPPSHPLFSRLGNHSTVSLTVPLGDKVFLGAYFKQFISASPDVNKNKGG